MMREHIPTPRKQQRGGLVTRQQKSENMRVYLLIGELTVVIFLQDVDHRALRMFRLWILKQRLCDRAQA